jgi:hypothetical protein
MSTLANNSSHDLESGPPHFIHITTGTASGIGYCVGTVPEFFGVEFGWGELSGGLIAVLLVVAFGLFYSRKN